MEQNSLYDRPDLYNLMAPQDEILERFYIETARERGGRVLDLACGSGRLTIPLAQAGLDIIGADLSSAMLESARTHARAHAVEPEFIELDMRDFDLVGQTFDTIIVAMNSVLHLHSLDDSEASSDPWAATCRRRDDWCSTSSCRTLPCSTPIRTIVDWSEGWSTMRSASSQLKRPCDTNR